MSMQEFVLHMKSDRETHDKSEMEHRGTAFVVDANECSKKKKNSFTP